MKLQLFILFFLLAFPCVLASAEWSGSALFQDSSESTDVLVVGGSPAGVAAALSAARQGDHVILVESRPYLGEPATSAMLNMFDMDRWGVEQSTVRGIFEEFYRKLGLTFNPIEARKFFLDEVRRVPLITLELNTHFEKPVVRGKQIEGILVSYGFLFRRTREIRASAIIDCTDDGDVAAESGVPYQTGRQASGLDSAMQPASLLFEVSGLRWDEVFEYIENNEVPHETGGIHEGYAWGYSKLVRKYQSADPRIRFLDLNIGLFRSGNAWVNSLQIFGVDGTDYLSRITAYEEARKAIPSFVDFLKKSALGFENAHLVGIAPELYIRETRHVMGLKELTAKDILAEKVFWDRIAVASYPIDLHPYKPGENNPFSSERHVYTIPIRCIIASKIRNLFVASRAFSATYEAAGSGRIIPTTIALGQAAGVAAAVCVENKISAHELAGEKSLIRDLQHRLMDAGAQLNP